MSQRQNDEEEKFEEMLIIKEVPTGNVDKEFDKNYNNLLKLKQEMLESKESKRRLKMFNCSSLMEKKKSEMKLLSFVIFLFVAIMGGLIVIYCFHEEDLYYIYKGPNIVVNERTLDFQIFNHKREAVASGTFWKSRPKDRLPFDCSGAESKSRDLCLLWKKRTRLNIVNVELSNETRCYEVEWTTDEEQQDCFDVGDAQWFGGGLIEGKEWPLQKHSFSRRKFLTGKLSHGALFGPVVERYWLNSNGVAIVVAENSSLEISMRQNAHSNSPNSTGPQFCLYASPDRIRNDSELKYSICIAPDILEVHRVALPLALESGNASKDEERLPANLFFNPFWSTWSNFKTTYNQENLLGYAAHIKGLGLGYEILLVDEGWEHHYGDVMFDGRKFPDPTSMVDSLQRHGFNVSLVVHTQINTDSQSFHEAAFSNYLVTDKGGQVPGLIIWSSEASRNRNAGVAGILDVSKNASSWQLHRLNDFKQRNSIDYFHFSGGEMSSLPFQPSFRRSMPDPNDYTKLQARFSSSFGPIVLVDSAYKAQNLPVIVRISGRKSTWSHLQSIIPAALNLGLVGYKLFLPEAVGGSAFVEPPTKDLYTRWFQLNTFMPFMHLSIPPDQFGNDTETMALQLLELRRTLVVPEILRVYETSLPTEPIIRPVWWFSREDKEALERKDEFLVGDKILVAPVVTLETEYRDIYLPDGLWEDRNNDQVHVGPKMLVSYRVPLNKVAYFIKK